jgi:hypothetical protein
VCGMWLCACAYGGARATTVLPRPPATAASANNSDRTLPNGNGRQQRQRCSHEPSPPSPTSTAARAAQQAPCCFGLRFSFFMPFLSCFLSFASPSYSPGFPLPRARQVPGHERRLQGQGGGPAGGGDPHHQDGPGVAAHHYDGVEPARPARDGTAAVPHVRAVLRRQRRALVSGRSGGQPGAWELCTGFFCLGARPIHPCARHLVCQLLPTLSAPPTGR